MHFCGDGCHVATVFGRRSFLFLFLTPSGPVNQRSTSEGDGAALNESQFSGSSECTVFRVEALQPFLSLCFFGTEIVPKKVTDEKNNTGNNNTVWRRARGHCEGDIHPSQCTVTRSHHVFSRTAQHLFSSFFFFFYRCLKKMKKKKEKNKHPTRWRNVILSDLFVQVPSTWLYL